MPIRITSNSPSQFIINSISRNASVRERKNPKLKRVRGKKRRMCPYLYNPLKLLVWKNQSSKTCAESASNPVSLATLSSHLANA